MLETELRQYPKRRGIAHRSLGLHSSKRQSFKPVTEDFARRLAAQSESPMRTRQHKSQRGGLGVGCVEGQSYCSDRVGYSCSVYGPLDCLTISKPPTRTGQPLLAGTYVVGNRIASKRRGFDVRRTCKPSRNIPFARRPKQQARSHELRKTSCFHDGIFALKWRQRNGARNVVLPVSHLTNDWVSEPPHCGLFDPVDMWRLGWRTCSNVVPITCSAYVI
jgi:hypothetical protein